MHESSLIELQDDWHSSVDTFQIVLEDSIQLRHIICERLC